MKTDGIVLSCFGGERHLGYGLHVHLSLLGYLLGKEMKAFSINYNESFNLDIRICICLC